MPAQKFEFENHDSEQKAQAFDSPRFFIPPPSFKDDERLDQVDFDIREWMPNSDNEIKLISDEHKVIRIITDTVILETGPVKPEVSSSQTPIFRYFAKLANRLTIISTSPMKFVAA